jgi:hypothetical protein
VFLSPEKLLRHCARCGAWPMSAWTIEKGPLWGRIRFRCPRCPGYEVHKMGAAAKMLVSATHADKEENSP